jgi:hypothetical protein
MNPALVIITCPGREAMLERTVRSLVETDFEFGAGHFSMVKVQHDENTCERKQERQERNSLAALEGILTEQPAADVILFCEDDILFNRHLRWNLEHWQPLLTALHHGERFFGSLYDPTIRELSANPLENYFIADPAAVYGSQCFVMTRPMAEYFVRHWWEVEGMQDIKMSRLAHRDGVQIYYHLPSLVQHVGVKSTWTDDARFHDTKMFDLTFKARR